MKGHRKIVPILPEDKDYFEKFYCEYKRFLLYIAKSFTESESECEDVVHDAVVRLMRNVPTLRTLDKPQLYSYMAKTVERTYIDHYRRDKRLLSPEDDFWDNLEGKERELVPDLFMRWEVKRLRQELPPKEWLALKGKYMLGYSHEELGALLGVSPNSLRMLLHRVRLKARKILYEGNVTGGGGK